MKTWKTIQKGDFAGHSPIRPFCVSKNDSEDFTAQKWLPKTIF